MKNLIPYIIISEKCEEAINFYKDCFDGEIKFMQKYSETNYPVSENFKSKIAHAEFKAENIHFYLSDGFENQNVKIGENIALSINFDNQTEQRNTYEKLKLNGSVTMEFAETSANSTLATLTDKYGINWYLNYEKTE